MNKIITNYSVPNYPLEMIKRGFENNDEIGCLIIDDWLKVVKNGDIDELFLNSIRKVKDFNMIKANHSQLENQGVIELNKLISDGTGNTNQIYNLLITLIKGSQRVVKSIKLNTNMRFVVVNLRCDMLVVSERTPVLPIKMSKNKRWGKKGQLELLYLIVLSPDKFILFGDKVFLNEIIKDDDIIMEIVKNYMNKFMEVNLIQDSFIIFKNNKNCVTILKKILNDEISVEYINALKNNRKIYLENKEKENNICINSDFEEINCQTYKVKKNKLVICFDTNISAQLKKNSDVLSIYNLKTINILECINKISVAIEKNFSELYISNLKTTLLSLCLSVDLKNMDDLKNKINLLGNKDLVIFLNSDEIFGEINKLFKEEKKQVLNKISEENFKTRGEYKLLEKNKNKKIQIRFETIANYESFFSRIQDKENVSVIEDLRNGKLNDIEFNEIGEKTHIHEINHLRIAQSFGYCLENFFYNVNIEQYEHYKKYADFMEEINIGYLKKVINEVDEFLNYIESFTSKEKKITIQKVKQENINNYLKEKEVLSIITLFIIDFLYNFIKAKESLNRENLFKKHLEGFDDYGKLNEKYKNTIIDFVTFFLYMIVFPKNKFDVIYVTNDKGIRTFITYYDVKIKKIKNGPWKINVAGENIESLKYFKGLFLENIILNGECDYCKKH